MAGSRREARHVRLLVVASQTDSLLSQAVEGIVHEGVHDRHGLLGDTSLRVYLLQHLVHVAGVGLYTAAAAACITRLLGGLGGGLLGGSLGHGWLWYCGW